MVNLDGILSKVVRPARYTGGEWNSIKKDWSKAKVKIALAYPDIYEIGMSNLGLSILYALLNQKPYILAERVYAPWIDMAAELRKANIPLFSLESRRPLRDFDILGFSLGYELTYTNVLNMLDLAQIPLFASQRENSLPLVIAGGSCALNPEPMSEFVDLFVIGEGEEVTLELVEVFRRWKEEGARNKQELLRELSQVRGIYIPSLHKVSFSDQNDSKTAEVKKKIERRVVAELPPPVTRPVVPYIEVVHDRGAVEIQRGCTRGCRFCQAGIIYRPNRERAPEEIVKAIDDLVMNCGYEEISLLSLSSSDYSGINELISSLAQRYKTFHLNLSLPSLRPDSFSAELADSIELQRKLSLTFAPEVASERLQRVINKFISEDDLIRAIEIALNKGWHSFKLYFMIGLPMETEDDVKGIVKLVQKVKQVKGKGGNRPNIRLTVATFIPKPHTPFQWVAQNTEEELSPKLQILKQGIRKAQANLSWQDPKVSLLEGILSRGDHRLSKVIYRAWQLGCVFDAWSDSLDLGKWEQAFDECGIDPRSYLRSRSLEENLPWSFIDTGVSLEFLKREYRRAEAGLLTPDCHLDKVCIGCGLQRWNRKCASLFKAKNPL